MNVRSTRRRSAPRIPLNTFAVGFGLAGLATLWTTVAGVLGWGETLPEVLWVVAAIAWGWLIVAHLRRGRLSDQTLGSQLRHPAQGPIAAVVPLIGVLLGVQLSELWPLGGAALSIVSIAAAAVFGGWILSYWHRGTLTPEAFHGGYLLPTVAAGFVTAIAGARLHLPGVAMASFAIGVFFWVVLVTVLLSRLAFFPPLPDPLTPTLAILLAPPALAGTAWFAMNGLHRDPVAIGLIGILVVMLVLQLFMLPTYLRLRFTLGFWSFTFPVAAAAGYGVQWSRLAGFAGWQVSALGAAGLASALILGVALRSVVLVTGVRRGARRAEQTLRRADDQVARAEGFSQPSPAARSGR